MTSISRHAKKALCICTCFQISVRLSQSCLWLLPTQKMTQTANCQNFVVTYRTITATIHVYKNVYKTLYIFVNIFI